MVNISQYVANETNLIMKEAKLTSVHTIIQDVFNAHSLFTQQLLKMTLHLKTRLDGLSKKNVHSPVRFKFQTQKISTYGRNTFQNLEKMPSATKENLESDKEESVVSQLGRPLTLMEKYDT